MEAVRFHTHLCSDSFIISAFYTYICEKQMIKYSLWKVFDFNLEFFFFACLLVLVPDWDPVLIPSLHCAIDLRGPRLERCEELRH